MHTFAPALHTQIGLEAFGFYNLLKQVIGEMPCKKSPYPLHIWSLKLGLDKEKTRELFVKLADQGLIYLEININRSTSCEEIFVQLECLAPLKRGGGRGGVAVSTTLNLDLDHRDLNNSNNINNITRFNNSKNVPKPKVDCPYWTSKDPVTKCNDNYCKFGEFWAIYITLKPADRWRAHKCFYRLTKKNPSLADVIICDAETRKLKHVGWKERKYIPHATTHLNRRGWEDPIIGEQHYVRSTTHSRLSAKTETLLRVYDFTKHGTPKQQAENRREREKNNIPF